jgi:hypothetical protein
MSSRTLLSPRTGVLVVVAVVVAAACSKSERPQAPASEGETEQEVAAAPQRHETPAAEVQIAPPTAPWLAAPADPIVVGEAVLADRRDEEEVSIGGGLVQLTADRRKYSLYVPDGAVIIDARVELTAVASLPGAPFADQQISAEAPSR